MKKVYFYFIIENYVDVNGSGGDYGSSVYYSLNGNSVVHMSEYFNSFEECSDSRKYFIENYPNKTITPIIEGLLMNNEQ